MLAAMAGTADHVPRDRVAWDRWAAEYAGASLRNWAAAEPAWGIWNIAEAQAGVLPADLEGRDSIELGCGTGYVSAWPARRGLAARRAGQLGGAAGHRPPAAGPLRAAVPADCAVRAARGSSPPGRHRLPAVRREGGRQSGDQRRTASLLSAASRAVEPARWRAGSAVPGAPVSASAARIAGRRWQ